VRSATFYEEVKLVQDITDRQIEEMLKIMQPVTLTKGDEGEGLYVIDTTDVEFGLPNVLLVTPPMCLPTWHRYDSTLDWMEESQLHGQEPRVLVLKEQPYPWNCDRQDLKTLKAIPADEWRWRARGYGDPSRGLGKTWRWVVPAEVAAPCKFFRLFKDDETIRGLKPLLYVRWS
jgi:hypothetical protein